MAQPINGNVHTALLEFAAREEVDILILGAHGHAQASAQLPAGRTAASVLRCSLCALQHCCSAHSSWRLIHRQVLSSVVNLNNRRSCKGGPALLGSKSPQERYVLERTALLSSLFLFENLVSVLFTNAPTWGCAGSRESKGAVHKLVQPGSMGSTSDSVKARCKCPCLIVRPAVRPLHPHGRRAYIQLRLQLCEGPAARQAYCVTVNSQCKGVKSLDTDDWVGDGADGAQ